MAISSFIIHMYSSPLERSDYGKIFGIAGLVET